MSSRLLFRHYLPIILIVILVLIVLLLFIASPSSEMSMEQKTIKIKQELKILANAVLQYNLTNGLKRHGYLIHCATYSDLQKTN